MCILEGMAAGKVIISTNVGAIPEVVKNKENGVIIERGNVQALSDAMSFVIENVKFDNYASKNNISKIEENYSIKKMHKKRRYISTFFLTEYKLINILQTLYYYIRLCNTTLE